MSQSKLHYKVDGTWSGATDMNAGDPLNPWPVQGQGMTFSLNGYQQTYQNYINTDPNTHVLSLGAGHLAFILDDGISPNNIGARLAGIDVINGGAGGQLIDLTSPTYAYGDVTINAGSGNDIVMGNQGNETINGKAGNDLIWGGSGTDSLYGGTGNDTIYAGGKGADILDGGAGNDSLVAGDGNQSLLGGSGDDVLVAGMGNQVLNGGSGTNTIDFSKLTGNLSVSTGDKEVVVSSGASGSLDEGPKVVGPVGIEYTDTVTGASIIKGNNGNNFWDTSSKGGTFIGGTGNDLFHSESGQSTMTGGGGADIYQYEKIFIAPSHGNDVVTDFVVGTDHLDLSDLLKGQAGLKHATYDQVAHLVDNAQGTMVQLLTGGTFHDAVELNGVHNAALNDLILH